MSSEPSLWRLEKFIFLLYYSLLWLLSSQLIKFQIVADQLLPDDEVLALNVIADKLELKSVPYFTDQFCNRSASLYDVGIYCNCSYQKSTVCHIEDISLSNRGLTGIIPEELAKLTYLQTLVLSDNKLYGVIPASLGKLQFLYKVDLSNNLLTGHIPDNLGKLNPQISNMSENVGCASGTYQRQCYRSSPDTVGTMICAFFTLDLSMNQLNGPIPDSLGNIRVNENSGVNPSCSSLSISLSNNRLSGSIPATFGNLKLLSSLKLGENNLTGTLPDTLGNLKSLSSLWLQSNYFTGDLPESYANLSGLYSFSISGNFLSGPFPNFIKSWTSIRTLSLYGNNFNGSISPEIFKLPNLANLMISDVSNTSFQFPKEAKSSYMTNLIMRNCSITDEIPNYLFTMSSLKYLDLSFNNLTGRIPDSSTNLSLTYMSFANNKLDGKIPAWIGAARRIKIDLSNNSFSTLGFQLPSKGDLNLFNCCKPSSTAPTMTSLNQMIEKRCPGGKPTNHSLFINCGGEETSIDGNHYDSDNETSQFHVSRKGNWAYSNSGGFLSTSVNSSEYIRRVKCGISVAQAPLYEKARLSPTSLKYYGFCLRKGSYNVTLHFAEIVYAEDEDLSSSMKRIFDVYIQGERQLTDFNIQDSARGPNKNIAITNLTANVTNDSVLEIHLYWTGKGSPADSPQFNGPLISAIAVTPEFPIEDDKGLSPAHISLITVASIVFAGLLLLALAWAMGCFGKEELHESNGRITLDWKDRYKICLGIASGLKYLHDELPKGPRFKMVHRGIKPSNILLDGNLNAKISDFGNSVLYAEDYQENQFKVMKEEASHGYMAPEYLMFGAISCKYDVYGYGVVILEIVCGRRNAGQKLNQEQLDFLVEEVVLAESEGRLHEMVDKNLLVYDETEAMKILKLAVKCTNISASFRPTMSEVVSVLKGEKTIDDIWKPASTQILCQNCFKSLHEDDGVGDQQHA
ncbi:probable LRR receptor-like serine/threonine-protein kinase At1g53430 isoform X5 [Ziziphus jujuba]|uniref:non-specific serine/threonine protein kinase n=1 Tax=Ziziphus jujuba TaxID=326968 RepID=A0ABM4AAH3_ZIZJJ|nr:probable LRR receptor-like serine/threonine-protein kinase At1g53430 isoform X5 [Ziziphus jujuba]